MAETIAATTSAEAAADGDPTRLVVPRWPLSSRLKYAVIAFLWKRLILKPLLYYSEFKKYFIPPGENEPDHVKAYPVRKSLKVRIFFPPSYNPSTSSPETTTKLPTLLTCHGGGFLVGEPHYNDAWNRAFAKRHGFLVIALDYSKGPRHRFPAAVHDVEALVGCILADRSLPVDAARVAVAGWSAGGNLVLAASLLPSLRGRIRAAVPVYPLLDRATATAVKTRTRRYKPALGGFRARDGDFVAPMMGLFDWASLRPGQRCDDPVVSPSYAPREHLPAAVFLIGCELDVLAHEAWRMACRLAGRRVPSLDEPVGREEPGGKGELVTGGDERFAWEEETAEEDGGLRVRWLLVPDTVHGFDQSNIEGLVKDPVFMEDARIKTAKVIDLVGEWLLSGPLQATKS
ncbi:Alpha/Beta hydrolase protein [Thermothelomyces heterothallicus CBS 202.75]|uniref:Alpha/Beta hydrolase protein n=1 Tax=Thermothelomyces heterothallicus CBS 202.75 TaxID=1149848 RepID=UPI003743B367